MKKTLQYTYSLLMAGYGKLLCKIGWHEFVCSVQDYIDEFGYIPNDGRIPKVAKCNRCKINYNKES